MARPKAPTTPAAEFVRLLWRAPLMSLPFAGFFTVVMGAPWAWFGRMYLVALVFSYVIGLSVWAAGTPLPETSAMHRRKPVSPTGTTS